LLIIKNHCRFVKQMFGEGTAFVRHILQGSALLLSPSRAF